MLAPWKKNYHQPRQLTKKHRHYFADIGPSGQSYGFSSGHVWMWELDYKEICVLKNWCSWTVVLEKTLEDPMDCKEIKPVTRKRNQSWIYIGRTDAEVENPNSLATWCEELTHCKDPDAWKDWRQEEKGMTEDRMVDGITNLMDVSWVSSRRWWWTGSPWGRKESEMTEWLNWTEIT